MQKSSSLITQHGRPGIRCAGLDTRIRDFIKLLDHELSGDAVTNRNGAKRNE